LDGNSIDDSIGYAMSRNSHDSQDTSAAALAAIAARVPKLTLLPSDLLHYTNGDPALARLFSVVSEIAAMYENSTKRESDQCSKRSNCVVIAITILIFLEVLHDSLGLLAL
jgi:hypothetical protein